MNKRTILSENPSVFTIQNFITDKECNHFMDIARDKLQIALVSTDVKGQQSTGRTGKNCWILHDHDKITKSVGEKISKMVGIPLNCAESYQIIYYDKEQEYRNHYDGWLHDKSAKSIRCMKQGGQRLRTALVYLNDVEEGGETRMTKLNIDVNPEKGKLLVFTNVQGDTNIRHEMTEHAGRPVIKGEKWAFNLWFREAPRNVVVYNPEIIDNTSDFVESAIKNIQNSNKSMEQPKKSLVDIIPVSNNVEVMQNNTQQLDAVRQDKQFTIQYSEIKGDPVLRMFRGAITQDMVRSVLTPLKFDKNQKKTAWLKNNDYGGMIDYISQLVKIDKNYLENISIVQYPPQHSHNKHFDAFSDDRLSKESRGQRLTTITGFLTPGFVYSFSAPKIKEMDQMVFEPGTIIAYNNVFPETNIRDNRLSKCIINNSYQHSYLFHIFVRDKIRPDAPTTTTPTLMPNTQSAQSTPNTQGGQVLGGKNFDINENYTQTLLETYKAFQNGSIPKSGYKSLTFSNIRTDWEHVVSTINQLYSIRSKSQYGIVPKERLEDTYKFDEFTPVIIENAINDEALKCIADYYKYGIDNDQFPFGDRQSQRYKARNDPVARMLNYEILPLVERFTGEKLRPTYSYLSCYKKGADLPIHTDNFSCKTTISLLIDKPKDTNWNIYFHTKKQAVKHKGRYNGENPPYEECIPCDVQKPGGLMAFDGTDHLHFRETLEHDYYYLLLLHYVPYDDTDTKNP